MHWTRGRRISFSVAAAMCVGMAALFQNCGESPRIQATFASRNVAQKLANGEYCTALSEDDTVASKFLFIVDMSRSNLGAFNGRRWNMAAGTDVNGLRFDQIQTFIQGCGATSARNKFQVMIFSDAAGVPSGNNTSTALSCTTPFANGAGALTQLQKAKDAQARDKAFWQQYVNKDWDAAGQTIFNSGQLSMLDTHYKQGLDCVSQSIRNDQLTTPSDISHYIVFYVTDGRPYDKASACETSPDKYGCYADEAAINVTNMAIDAKAVNNNLQLFPIYYGFNDENDRINALRVLDKMAKATGVKGAISVDEASGAGAAGIGATLCSLTQVARKLDYRKELLSVVNLNAKPVGEKLMADTDMDGISDEDELRLGYDPKNPRTYGVLDSICEIAGGKDPCLAAMSRITCTGTFNNLGLTDCDLKTLGVVKKATTPDRQFGIDTDNDGVTDLVELLRGTNPTLADSSRDMDSDGLTNLQEINRGSDVERRSVGATVPYALMKYDETLVTVNPFCSDGSESWAFSIDDIPVVPTMAFTSTAVPSGLPTNSREAEFNFSHRGNENLILLTYKLTPVNALAAAPQMWGALLRVKVGLSSNGKYQAEYENLTPENFFFLGELK